MKFFLNIRFWIVMAAITALGLTSSAVSAHERRDVGQYELEVGWIVEPPFEGLKNGVFLEVKKGKAPIEGLQNTLKVEVTHVSSRVSKVMNLRPIPDEPGHYTADLIPTAPGQYRFRLFGTIEGTSVNETFESGPDRFDHIVSPADLQFPTRLPEAREVEGAVRGAQGAAQQAQDLARQADASASSASTLAIVGIVLGAVGIASGAGGVVTALWRR